CSGAPRALPSFPTRRSSDLAPGSTVLGKVRLLRVEPACRPFPASEPGVLRRNCPRLRSGRDRLDTWPRWLAASERRTCSHAGLLDRKSTRLNSSHVSISYAV